MFHRFTNDYSETAHPAIMQALTEALGAQNTGYGLDGHSERAEKLILERFGIPDGAVFFLAGGTQTNMTVISFLLKPYECALACGTGHINVHETGAVEATGHKIYTVPGRSGKLSGEDVLKAFKAHTDEHMVKPGVVYISDSTEVGTIYTADELRGLRAACDSCGLYLFMDGARLGAALAAADNDLTPELIGSLCDVFYVGGTKNGMLFGEAVVFRNKALAECFRYHVKNRGAMLAKGFVPAIMFERAFEDNLYFEMADNADRMADRIREGLKGHVTFASGSTTNQIFITLPREDARKVIDAFGCELWTDLGDNMTVRIVTSFATTEGHVREVVDYIKGLSAGKTQK